MPSKKNEISLPISPNNGLYRVASLPVITSDIDADLIACRRLMAISLSDDDLGSALCFAVAASKLLPVVVKKQLRDHELLTAPAVMRLAKTIVDTVSSHYANHSDYEILIDEACRILADLDQ